MVEKVAGAIVFLFLIGSIAGCGGVVDRNTEAVQKLDNTSEPKESISHVDPIISIQPEAEPVGSALEISEKHIIDHALPEYTFVLYGQEREYIHSAYKIAIFKSGQQKPLQELIFEPTETMDSAHLGFIVEDMNFDGYNDIRIQANLPAAPNIPYYCWLWEAASSRFVPSEELEAITSPEFDPKHQEITTFGRSSSVEHFWETYKYIGGLPTLIYRKDERIDPSEDTVYTEIHELVNGDYKLTKTIEEPWEGE
ncbi:hypothetical protein [Paenibacillus sp. P46E]|uniref:XAC2610-related protein n=1 Tax=Paenibacillus sp. P46E TaxID=1349436 RepID=UPI00093D74BE|nr:hypothetical protein [Paenibacillus sp. P46E]OKP95506.1 hypothetical protein A3849_25765 [Paenibacillus sp. P46E]